jgi:hypothetical protein
MQRLHQARFYPSPHVFVFVGEGGQPTGMQQYWAGIERYERWI